MIAAIVKAGWVNLKRDRGALILSFVVPLVFFSIFASIFTAQRSKTPSVKLAIVDEDRSDRSRQLVKALQAESALTVLQSPKKGAKPFTLTSAEAFVRAGNAPVALVIPKGFSTSTISFGPAGEQTTFRLLADIADPLADQVVEGLLQKAAMVGMPEMMMDGGVAAVDRWSGGLTPQQHSTIQQSMDSFKASRTKPGVKKSGDGMLIKVAKTDLMGQTKKNSIVALYAAGIGVMFLLFSATNAGGALLEENESGTLDRILTTRVSFGTLLVGKLVYLWTLGFAQLCVMFTWAAIAFKLELIDHLGGFVLMAAATTLTTSAFGLLLASVCHTRAQLSALSTLVVLTVSALGGSMFPRFLMPEALQKAGLVLFNSWAIDGFTNLFWRDLPLSSLFLPVVMLLGFAVVFFAAARQLTRRWEVS